MNTEIKRLVDGGKINPDLPHYEVRVFLADRDSPFDDQTFARFAGLPEGPAYGSDLNAIVSVLNSGDYWWHLSHLEAVVIPTRTAKGLEGVVSNGAAYDREGRPVEYRADFASDNPARALCEALLKARYDLPAAFAVQASAKAEAWAKPVATREQMMAYYNARENLRQDAIERIAAEHEDK